MRASRTSSLTSATKTSKPRAKTGSKRLRQAAPMAPAPRLNDAESPLAWLHRRKDKAGNPLIGDAAFAAGERLRADYTRAGLMPATGVDWSLPSKGRGRKSGGRGPADILDAALDARDRVNTALGAVGPELGGILVDVCCHLYGLEQVERARGWPKRSAKVVLEMALSRLARHYGIGEARGPARGRTRQWGTEDYRPTIDG